MKKEYAFVYLKDEKDVEKAIKYADGRYIGDREIKYNFLLKSVRNKKKCEG